MSSISALTFRLLVVSWITAKTQLIHDNTASRTKWNNIYDFILVGAGASGCVVAKRLAENSGISVLLLEAGGAQDSIYTDIVPLLNQITDNTPYLQWMDYTEPQRYAAQSMPQNRILQRSGKALGGSSTHNQLVFNRGNPRDYDEWVDKYGAIGWSFKEVLPFFKKFENNTDQSLSSKWHGREGPMQITTSNNLDEKLINLKEIYSSLGFRNTDINGGNQLGFMNGQSFIDMNGFRVSSSTAYIDPNPYPNNLHIITKAFVTKIIFKGLTAIGVEFERNDMPFKVLAKKEVIISAGAVRTPQLLMLSGIGPNHNLQHLGIPVILDLPVGVNYKNHVTFKQTAAYTPPISIRNLEQLYFESSGPLSQIPYVIILINTKHNEDIERPNVYQITTIDQNGDLTFLTSLGRVRSRGRVRLQSTDPHIQPSIDPKIFNDWRDYNDSIEALKFMFYIKQKPSIVSVTAFPTLESAGCPSCPGLKDYECDVGLDCFARKFSRTPHHPSGTCRMGDINRDDVVVDPYLRVKNTKNLRVCDASIFPELPNCNAYAPTLMVGEKCAQIIKDCYDL